jgi:hypothetical protein
MLNVTEPRRSTPHGLVCPLQVVRLKSHALVRSRRSAGKLLGGIGTWLRGEMRERQLGA